MSTSTASKFHDIISGRAGGGAASLARASLSIAKIPYTGAIALRNWLYDGGVLRSHRIDRPIVCVGNLTTGGTGKTPIVRWLADRLRRANRHPAVLVRGYRTSDEGSDEQRLLRRLLDPVIPVEANADRVRGARAIVRDHPNVDVVLLDDGFQHRRLHRDFDLVLIDATNPFGHDHLLPRGLLREPMSGLARASAILITHLESVTHFAIEDIESRVRAQNRTAPIFRASHHQTGISFSRRRIYAFSGIGNPEAFERQLPSIVGSHRFDDHHAYTKPDIAMLQSAARELGADLLVTTEKDWIKVENLVGHDKPELAAVGLEVQFELDHESRLFAQILEVIPPRSSSEHSAARAVAE